jgi:hypothetical protein
VPMTTATARSTTLPRSRNFLKPSTLRLHSRAGPVRRRSCRPRRSGRGTSAAKRRHGRCSGDHGAASDTSGRGCCTLIGNGCPRLPLLRREAAAPRG